MEQGFVDLGLADAEVGHEHVDVITRFGGECDTTGARCARHNLGEGEQLVDHPGKTVLGRLVNFVIGPALRPGFGRGDEEAAGQFAGSALLGELLGEEFGG